MTDEGAGSAALRQGPFTVRCGRAEDAAALAGVFHSAVHAIASRHYTPEQIAAWCPEVPPAELFRQRVCDGRKLWVAADEADVAAAFIDLEQDGHIDMLFCHPRAAGQGVAAALCRQLEAAALAQGLGQLHVNASEAARGFFERQGFAVERRREVERRGVTLHNYRMVKSLI